MRFSHSLLCASTIAMVGLTVACGGSDDSTVAPPVDTGVPVDSTIDSGVDGTPPIDTAVVDTATVDAPPDALTIDVKALTLLLSQTTTVAGGTTTYSTLATARLLDTTASGGGKCTLVRIGNCDIAQCDLTSAGDGGVDSGVAKAANANDIHFTSATIGDIEIYANSFGLYNVLTGTRKLFAAGDVVKTTAAGADIPAWTDKPGTAPGDVTLTAPACASGACPDVDRTADLEATWTGGTTGDVTATLETTQVGTKSVAVACTFKASDGKGTIPKAALSKLDKADGTTITGLMSIAPSSASPFKSGAYDVVLFIRGSGGSGTFKVSK